MTASPPKESRMPDIQMFERFYNAKRSDVQACLDEQQRLSGITFVKVEYGPITQSVSLFVKAADKGRENVEVALFFGSRKDRTTFDKNPDVLAAYHRAAVPPGVHSDGPVRVKPGEYTWMVGGRFA